MGLAQKFQSLFEEPRAKRALARLKVVRHTNLPTFNLATTSLRHLNKWFDRLDEINRGISGGHGNYYSDPATIGLVTKTGRPPVLTPAGLHFLSFKDTLNNDRAKAEYKLIKILYFSDYIHSPDVQEVLEAKQKHMLKVLSQHSFYTSDIVIWFDGTSYQASSSLAFPVTSRAISAVRSLALQAQTGLASGTSSASANDAKRKRRRAAKPTKTTIIIDQIASERSEDFIEFNILSPQYGPQLVRVGHRVGEILSLPDGLVPGADFYVINEGDEPIEFIEIKSISGNPPVDISLTRAEYLRACRCAEKRIPYRLFLVNLSTGRIYKLSEFASEISGAELSEVVQFTVRVG